MGRSSDTLWETAAPASHSCSRETEECWREQNVQENTLSLQPRSRSKAMRVAIQPMTRAPVTPRTTRPIMHAKKHTVTMTNKRKTVGCLSNRDSPFSQDWREHPSPRLTKRRSVFTQTVETSPNLAPALKNGHLKSRFRDCF